MPIKSPILEFVDSVLVQPAIYWGEPVPDGYGNNIYSDVRQIMVRWEERSQMVVSNEGKEVVSRAEVLVNEDLSINGWIALGALDIHIGERHVGLVTSKGEIITTSKGEVITASVAHYPSPEEFPNAGQILEFRKTPLFRSKDEFVRSVLL